jgi:hypothetical protein
MSQPDISRATVERLRAERAATTDPAHLAALDNQIRLHSELAGLATGGAVDGPPHEFEDPPALVVPKPAKPKVAEG